MQVMCHPYIDGELLQLTYERGEELEEGLCVEQLYQMGRELEAGLHRVLISKFLLPWFTGTHFMLYVFDHMNKKLNVIDPSPVPEWCLDIPYRKYGLDFAYFYKKYIAAMNVNSPNWNQNIYKWKFTREKEIFEDEKGYSTGYLVLQYMSTWKSIENTEIYTRQDDC
ncbi:hypothetical protein C2845_PM01G47630 [Panicum miliaceum]|uniref:Uncharacterized protein n=1 Tax=Panicum miliaceum TaxID=4540 RepID=A0A3L6TRK6_PANMI|nr:hypothetical protein C2845_PM01G47630 [Panicum miliaceum]